MLPLTPPLLPLSPPQSPFTPVKPFDTLIPLSDPADPFLEQTEATQSRLMEQDSLVNTKATGESRESSGDHPTATLPSPIRFIAETPVHSPPVKRKIEDLRVEGPLTPKLLTDHRNKRPKAATVSAKINEYTAELPSTFLNDQDLGLEAGADYLTLLNDTMTGSAAEAERLLRNEKLVEADCTKRVKVPEIAQRPLTLPWAQYSQLGAGKLAQYVTESEAQRDLLRDIKRYQMAHVKSWHGNSQTERHLSWIPFPLELAKVQSAEAIDAGDALNKLIAQVNVSETLDSSMLCWKLPGLRILDEAWEPVEDDLERAAYNVIDLQLNDPVAPKQARHEVLTGHNVLKGQAFAFEGRDDLRQQTTHQKNIQVPYDNGLLFGGAMFDTADILQLLNSHDEPSETPAAVLYGHSPRLETCLPIHESSSGTSVSQSEHLLYPELPQDLPNRPFIIRSDLFNSHRSLLKQIKALYPAADLIEREWTHSEQQSRNHSGESRNLPDEGDIIASPSTTLVLTTLAKIKQRPLPGQEARHYGVTECVSNVCDLFERVVVLVSSGAAAITSRQLLDEHDALAFTGLVGASTSMSAEVQVLNVPGGELELAKWTISMMLRYSMNDDVAKNTVRLLQEQTLWETFLRRAGFNSFAAQALLHSLKAPTSAESAGGISDPPQGMVEASPSGLAALIAMPSDERLRQLSPLLGGSKLLKRFNEVCGRGWQEI